LVVATGYKIGMAVFGGFGEMVQLPSDWLVKLPSGLTLQEAMNIGTAGLTAGASVKKIIDSGISKDLPVLVSGATGGVGSVAVNLLSKLGYEVHALTGKSEESETLKIWELSKYF
jgi:NADPH:quinone reductase-like Zn-dependent oxidoreductase